MEEIKDKNNKIKRNKPLETVIHGMHCYFVELDVINDF